jgi:hypothetical protein
MAESQLRKLEAEKERLQAELKTLQEAISTREACEDMIKHVELKAEPFAADQQGSNPWLQSPGSQTPCKCVIM